MKNIVITSLVTALGFAAGNLFAGEAPTPSSKAPKNPPPMVVPSLCDCFDPGKVQVSLYGAGIIFSGDSDQDDALGGGLSFGYFFTENIGIETDATWLATDSTIHSFSANLVLRYPIKSACIAPYIIAGGGLETDGSTNGTWDVGGGIDIRLGHGPLCPGIFADARYTWTGNDADFTLIRVGFRCNL